MLAIKLSDTINCNSLLSRSCPSYHSLQDMTPLSIDYDKSYKDFRDTWLFIFHTCIMFPVNTIIACIINYYHKHEYANKPFYYCL